MVMRGCLVLVVLSSADAADAACVLPLGNARFVPGPMVESTPPSEITVGEVRITRFERNRECPASTEIDIGISATDDTTPSDRIGVRVRIGETAANQLPSSVVIIIRLQGADSDLDFDIGLSAIDESGNLGPEIVIPIDDEAPGCNATGIGPESLMLGLIGLLGLRRHRR